MVVDLDDSLNRLLIAHRQSGNQSEIAFQLRVAHQSVSRLVMIEGIPSDTTQMNIEKNETLMANLVLWGLCRRWRTARRPRWWSSRWTCWPRTARTCCTRCNWWTGSRIPTSSGQNRPFHYLFPGLFSIIGIASSVLLTCTISHWWTETEELLRLLYWLSFLFIRTTFCQHRLSSCFGTISFH